MKQSEPIVLNKEGLLPPELVFSIGLKSRSNFVQKGLAVAFKFLDFGVIEWSIQGVFLFLGEDGEFFVYIVHSSQVEVVIIIGVSNNRGLLIN